MWPCLKATSSAEMRAHTHQMKDGKELKGGEMYLKRNQRKWADILEAIDFRNVKRLK